MRDENGWGELFRRSADRCERPEMDQAAVSL